MAVTTMCLSPRGNIPLYCDTTRNETSSRFVYRTVNKTPNVPQTGSKSNSEQKQLCAYETPFFFFFFQSLCPTDVQ